MKVKLTRQLCAVRYRGWSLPCQLLLNYFLANSWQQKKLCAITLALTGLKLKHVNPSSYSLSLLQPVVGFKRVKTDLNSALLQLFV